MPFKNSPIKRKLRSVILLTCGIVLLLTCATFIVNELLTFRRVAISNLTTLGQIMAENSSAALAFRDENDAREVLASLHAESEITAAVLYDENGKLFAQYFKAPASIPSQPEKDGYRLDSWHLKLFQPVTQGSRRYGTLYLESDLSEMYQHLTLYGFTALLVLAGSFIIAFIVSNVLQKQISSPILSLAKMAKNISERHDYSMRAKKESDDEIGYLTDAFNQMLMEIQENQRRVRDALEKTTRSEELVKDLNSNLERRVDERTTELREAIANMEAFSYSVSHDLRGPLRSMQGYAEVLMQDHGENLNAEAKGHLKRIVDSASRMDTLIQDILTYSRVARSDLDKQSINLEKLVHEIILQNPAFQPPHAEIKVESPLLKVSGHEAGLSQCFNNLLSNAVKFVKPGTRPQITIRTEPCDGMVKIWVQDNGIGIKPEYFEKIFRIFERAHSEKSYDGTGIGLAIVKKAVDRMGGKIGLESEIGKGTGFWIQLPRG